MTAKQVQNRITTLERGFKRITDNNKKIGRSRKGLNEPDVVIRYDKLVMSSF